MSDEYSYEDAREFSEHPVKTYDPFGARDFAMFDSHFDMFKKFLITRLREIIHDIETFKSDPDSLVIRKEIADLYKLKHQAVSKCHAYALHTGIHLMPRKESHYDLLRA